MKTPSGMAFNRFMLFVAIISATAIGYIPQALAQTAPNVIELQKQIQELSERVRVLEEQMSVRSKDAYSLPDPTPSKPPETGKPADDEVSAPPEQGQEMKW